MTAARKKISSYMDIPEIRDQFMQRSTKELFSYLKIGLTALTFAGIALNIMLYYSPGITQLGLRLGLIYGAIFVSMIYLFLISDHIESFQVRMAWVYVFATIISIAIGSAYYHFFGELSERMLMVFILFNLGIVTIASNVFALDRFVYKIFISALLVPVFVASLMRAASSPEAGFFYGMLCVAFLIVYSVMIVLHENDHRIRKQVILLEIVQNENLKRIQALKTEQDGDYFLTSLLIDPLAENSADAESYTVDFLTREKKHFRFRKWKRELGGDLNLASNIVLSGRKYIVFLNADAMGKSMQGAGGALVLGSVFKTILIRNRAMSGFDESPEAWLASTFAELQTLFETFNGSMLISVNLGLLDSQSGTLYHVNAEHPHLVLLRSGKAVFLPAPHHFKIGTIGENRSVRIGVYALQRNDVLFSGSDGKDDLLLGMDQEDRRVINEDEELFLRLIESGKSDLLSLYKRIRRAGKITDDLSLIRIQYTGDSPRYRKKFPRKNLQLLKEALRAEAGDSAIDSALDILSEFSGYDPDNLYVHQLIMTLQIKRRNYEDALKTALLLVQADPSRNRHLSVAAFCCMRLNRFQEAADLSKRLYLRDPGSPEAVIALAEAYQGMNKITEARNLIAKARILTPGNELLESVALNLGGGV